MTNQPDLTATVDRIIGLVQNAITDPTNHDTHRGQPRVAPANNSPTGHDTGRGQPRVDPAVNPPSDPAAKPTAKHALASLLTSGFSSAQPRVEMPGDPGLPTDLLPPHLEHWLTTMARITGVPPSMVTIPFLAATGGVIGNRLALELQLGWREYPTLWVALVALTGTRKTPALGVARLPFDLLHDELVATPAEPSHPLITPHATWDRLQHTIEQSRGLILYRDELVGLLRAIDGRRGEDRQRYLSLWSGDPLHMDDRVSIYHPVVSIIAGIQPLLLIRLRNRQPDGLLERFIPILAGGGTITPRRDRPRSLPPVEPVVDTLRLLHQHPTTIVTLAPEAESLWDTWHEAQIQLCNPAEQAIGNVYRKYPSQLARLALVLHALWHPSAPGQPLDRDTMDRAITLIEYLRIHLHRSLFFINERHPVRSPAELLASRIRETLASHYPHWLAHTHLARQLGRPPSAMFNAALDTLTSQNDIESRTRKQEGRGRPGLQYRSIRSDRSRTNSHEITRITAESPHEINDF